MEGVYMPDFYFNITFVLSSVLYIIAFAESYGLTPIERMMELKISGHPVLRPCMAHMAGPSDYETEDNVNNCI